MDSVEAIDQKQGVFIEQRGRWPKLDLSGRTTMGDWINRLTDASGRHWEVLPKADAKLWTR
jgi:hypothetical protein